MKIIILEKQMFKLSRLLQEQGELPTGSKEERIAEIEKRKKHILKKIPKMISYFNALFGDKIYEIKLKSKKVRYSIEDYPIEIPLLEFYFSDVENNPIDKYKKDIINDVKNLFNIEFNYYGVPFSMAFYKMVWKEF